MMNIRKQVRAIFTRPEHKLAAMLPELRELCRVLKCMSASRDSLTTIVRFFDIMSRWHDQGVDGLIVTFEKVNYGQHDETLKKLRVLKKHFENAGRNEFGWNRTKPGETVTADKVFLGNIFGLSTHPVSFWKQRKDEKRGGWERQHMEHFNAYDVVSRQAQEFMISHINPVIAIMNHLRAATT